MDYLIIGVLVVFSGVFSGLTLGLLGLDATEIERKAKLGDGRALKILGIRKKGNLLLCTLLLGNVAVNSAMAIFLGSIATGIIAGFVSTGLIVVFGEILPQAFFSRHAMVLGAKMTWVVKIFMVLLYPIAGPLALGLDKILGAELPTIWSKRELKEIIKFHEDSKHSTLDKDEERILLGALSFSDKLVQMVMTPKSVVYSLDAETSMSPKVLGDIRKKGFTRIPIYSDKEDNIVGILYTKKLIGINPRGSKVKEFIEKERPILVKETMNLDVLLNHFIKDKKHLAVVFDEFGTMSGLVTLEDIIEEVINVEILDEKDNVNDLRQLAKSQLPDGLLE